MKFWILGLVLAARVAVAGTESSGGGDLTFCEGDTRNSFRGYYSLDYLLTYNDLNGNSDVVPVQTWDQSRERILAKLRVLSPDLAESFVEFASLMGNFSDYSEPRVWEPASFGLHDIQDEEMRRRLPSNCYKREGSTDNSTFITQFIVRTVHGGVKGSGGYISYEFDTTLYRAIQTQRPLQLSFALVHEWLRDFTESAAQIRTLNRLLHSNALDSYDAEKFATILARLGWKGIAEQGQARREKFFNAVSLGDLKTVQWLLAHGLDLKVRDASRWDALRAASYAGRIEMVKYLLQLKMNPNESQALDAAVRVKKDSPKLNDHIEVARVLIAAGAEVNLKPGEDRFGPLYVAVDGGDEIVRLLLDNGADPIRANRGNFSILERATHAGLADDLIARLIVPGMDVNHQAKLHGGGLRTPLLNAVENRSTTQIEMLVKAGADIQLGNPLVAAADNLDVEVSQKLIELGANVNQGRGSKFLMSPPPIHVAIGQFIGFRLDDRLYTRQLEFSREQVFKLLDYLRFLVKVPGLNINYLTSGSNKHTPLWFIRRWMDGPKFGTSDLLKEIDALLVAHGAREE